MTWSSYDKQESMNKIIPYVGVDVSKARLDLATPSGVQQCANTPKAIATWLKTLSPEHHLIMEATGGYERALVAACHQAGLAVSVVNPARVRHFAKAHGRLAKTDAIDALVLRDFGAALQPAPQADRPASERQLAELVNARETLVNTCTVLTNTLEQAQVALVRQILTAQVRQLKLRIKKLETAMLACLQQCPRLAARAQALLAHPGIGLQTTAVLLAHLPELGSANRQQIAALAGLAPYNRDSGQTTGPRFISGGRPRLRRALYLASLSAIRAQTPLRDFYLHLRQSGKPAKVALIASARKLLCFLNTSLKTQHS